MKINFYKFQGAGNDFVIIDNRNKDISLSTEQINFLCDRRFGVGADGLMLLEPAEGFDYRMVYFNADGNESTMCGNGGRCIASFAKLIGAASYTQYFVAIDGPHQANILESNQVALQMQDVNEVNIKDDAFILNTGSPHYVVFKNDVKAVDVFTEGRNIRTQERFMPKGINVNFVEKTAEGLVVRTYERGVEDETLACGTGVTAAAIASSQGKIGEISVNVKAMGGKLNVRFIKEDENNMHDIWLTGPAELVFQGSVSI